MLEGYRRIIRQDAAAAGAPADAQAAHARSPAAAAAELMAEGGPFRCVLAPPPTGSESWSDTAEDATEHAASAGKHARTATRLPCLFRACLRPHARRN